ncbi:MAG: zinc ABC transporter solute-binding protein [Sulfitobacter sp.]|nr:zinc ABC transporter solute-binding protein [Sulfitobacter sp.]
MRRLLYLLVLMSPPALAVAPRVATDIAPVHSLVSQVMDGVGTPDLIIPPTASPHGYAMRPSEARALTAADLVVWIGPALTPWMAEPLEALAPNATHLTLTDADGMTFLPYRGGEAFETDDHHGHGHGHGHVEEHETADPHIWLDPMNGAQMLTAIADALAELDPGNAVRYRQNADAGRAELAALITEIDAQLTPAKNRPFIVFHDAFHYFEARFEIEAKAAVSTGDAAKPGAGRVASLRKQVDKAGVVCAFAEPQMDTAILATVIENQKTEVAILDPIGVDQQLGPDLYPGLLRALATGMADCLRP